MRTIVVARLCGGGSTSVSTKARTAAAASGYAYHVVAVFGATPATGAWVGKRELPDGQGVNRKVAMKLRAFVSLMLVTGGVPSARARMPFAADFAARDLGERQRGVVDDQKVSVGTAGP